VVGESPTRTSAESSEKFDFVSPAAEFYLASGLLPEINDDRSSLLVDKDEKSLLGATFSMRFFPWLFFCSFTFLILRRRAFP